MQLTTGVWSARMRKRATMPDHLAPGDRDWVESRVPFSRQFPSRLDRAAGASRSLAALSLFLAQYDYLFQGVLRASRPRLPR
jgi:hypothetical protein